LPIQNPIAHTPFKKAISLPNVKKSVNSLFWARSSDNQVLPEGIRVEKPGEYPPGVNLPDQPPIRVEKPDNSGQLPEPDKPGQIPEYPQVPDKPGQIPEYPQVPDKPGQIPEYPQAPDKPGQIPEYPQVPDKPGQIPEYPQVPDKPGQIPEYPQAPDKPGQIPEYPQVPDKPGQIPEYPQVPDKPGQIPEYPQVPDKPGQIPEYPQVPGNKPNIPQKPDISNKPGIRSYLDQQARLKKMAESLQTRSHENTDNLLMDVKANLDKLRGALDRYTAKRKLETPDCKRGECDTPDNAVEEVSTRFLKDVQFAKSKGVNLKDLLKALDDQKAKRHARTEEERQLQGLLKSKRDISEENLANVAM